jgi:hypothetical protein
MSSYGNGGGRDRAGGGGGGGGGGNHSNKVHSNALFFHLCAFFPQRTPLHAHTACLLHCTQTMRPRFVLYGGRAADSRSADVCSSLSTPHVQLNPLP